MPESWAKGEGPRPEAVASAHAGHPAERVGNVLLLHSYHSTYEWTSEVSRGISAVLEAAPYEIELWAEFMDAKRTLPETRREWMRDLLQRKYGRIRLDLVIAVDDDAAAYMAMEDNGLRRDIPVVYCGVSSPELIQRLPKERFTGVQEIHGAGDFLLAQRWFWRGEGVLVLVVDNSPTGKSMKELYARALTEFPRVKPVILDGAELTTEEILARLRGMPAPGLVLLSAFTRDVNGTYIPPQDAGRKISEAARAPVVSPNVSQLGQGLLAGNANSGFAHGKLTGEMAVRILRGEPLAEIPRQQHGKLWLVIDDRVGKRWGLRASDYPQDAIVVNEEAGWRKTYAENRRLIWAIALGFLAQTAVTLALVVMIVRKRRVEQELRASQANVERAQKIAKLGHWERDVKTGRLYWSDEVFRLYGYEPGSFELDSRKHLEMVHPEDRQRVEELIAKSDLSGKSRVLEFRIIRRDGSVRHMRSLGEWSRRPNGDTLVAGVVQDITELREMEEHFRHAQRVESLGNMAGGIAHDFNNLLTIINGYCQILLLKMGADDPNLAKVKEIHRAGERAAALTKQLLAFSRKQVMETRVLDLNELVESAEGLLRPLLGESISYRTELSEGLHAVKADPYQLEQVLVNLVVNSKDAMGDGGVLLIETRNEDLAGFTSWNGLEIEPGPYVRLVVTDSGHGMSEEVRQRVFEPFFTTKPQGKGTGLGLASVFGIVRQSDGYVSVVSQPGMGTSFHVLLPAADGQASIAEERTEALRPGEGRILIVEDEEQIRTLAAAALTELGYRVTAAAGPQEALMIDFSKLGTPELLVADIVMPGMSGLALAKKLRERWPSLRVLVMSGYPGRELDLEELGDAAFLAKPFLPAELADKVREMLGGGRSR
ncbi:MAG: response regulator [Acidobacteria bacterium]|nr:response regulator [Acidobacteriota bacterium]